MQWDDGWLNGTSNVATSTPYSGLSLDLDLSFWAPSEQRSAVYNSIGMKHRVLYVPEASFAATKWRSGQINISQRGEGHVILNRRTSHPISGLTERFLVSAAMKERMSHCVQDEGQSRRIICASRF